MIEQDYENGSPTGTPTDGVPITELTISDVTGSVADGAAPVYILCASCSDWVSFLGFARTLDGLLTNIQTWTDVAITGGTTSTECEGIPSGASC